MGEEWSEGLVYVLVFVMVAFAIGVGVLVYGSIKRT